MPCHPHYRLLAAVLTTLALAACSGSDETAPEDPGVLPDAGEETIDDVPDNCDLPSTLESPALSNMEAIYGNQPGSMGARQVHRMFAAIDGTETGLLQVELWDDRGVFAGAIGTTGTFTIEGAETDPDTCGVCVFLIGEHLSDGSVATFLAQSGTVTIDQLSGTMSGSVADLTFTEVGLYNEALGACDASLDGASFSAPITIVSGGGGGGGGGSGTGGGTGGGDGTGGGTGGQ